MTARSVPFIHVRVSAGIGVRMTEPMYIAPSLDDFARDVVFPQNLPSIVCVHVLDPQPGHLVLDMCAAPGQHATLSVVGNFFVVRESFYSCCDSMVWGCQKVIQLYALSCLG